MKTREKRRYLTTKYQQKQVRLAYTFSYDRPHDTQRYIRSEFARKRRFVDLLRGNFVEFKYSYQYDMMVSGYNTPHTFTKAELGRFRNHSWDDCGRPRCHHCSNPRRGWTWDSWKERQTMQERVSDMRFKDDLEYYYQHEEK